MIKTTLSFNFVAVLFVAAGWILSVSPAFAGGKTHECERSPVSDGKFFNVTKPADSDPTLTVPAGVVLTDAHVTFSLPENNPNSAALIVTDTNTSKFFVYQIVNSTTFNAGIDLESGISSKGQLLVQLSCYNITDNHCV